MTEAKTEKKKMKTGTKVAIWTSSVIVGVLLILFIICIVAANFMYNLALNPHYENKDKVFNSENNQMEITDEQKEQYEISNKWFEDIAPESKYIKSYDDLELHAYMIENSGSDKWVVICHGYFGEAKHMTPYAKNFYENGYNVLMPDARGHGSSEGDYIGMGWDERKDIVKWIDLIVEKDNNSKIILYGVSMGGATVMSTSGEDLPANVKAIVEDCGYSSVWGEFAFQLKEIFGLPTWPIMNLANGFTKSRAGYDLKEASALEQVKKCTTPMLFIHGDSDTFVPSKMVDEVFDAATNCEKEKIVVAGAGHGGASEVLKDEYWIKLFAFVDKYI